MFDLDTKKLAQETFVAYLYKDGNILHVNQLSEQSAPYITQSIQYQFAS